MQVVYDVANTLIKVSVHLQLPVPLLFPLDIEP